MFSRLLARPFIATRNSPSVAACLLRNSRKFSASTALRDAKVSQSASSSTSPTTSSSTASHPPVSATHDGREFFGDAAPPVPPATPPKPVNELFGDIGEPWFTTRIFMDTIEFVHNHLSLAWWGSIIATAVVARSLLLPIQIYNIKNMQGMADLQPQMKELQKIIVAAKTREEKLQAQIQMRDLFVKGGVNQWMLFLGPLTTMPVFLTFFAAIRHLVVNFAPSMAAGGALWFHDLTVSDPYLRLPIINAVVMLCNVQIGLDGMPAQSRGPATWLMRIVVLASVPIAAYFPSAMHVYWLTTSMYSLAFTLTMRQPGVRKLLKLAPARVISVPTIMPEKPPAKAPLRYYADGEGIGTKPLDISKLGESASERKSRLVAERQRIESERQRIDDELKDIDKPVKH